MKTQKLLTALLFAFFLFGISATYAQVTTSPDTVCAGTTGEPYSVTNTTGSTYYWVVSGGTQASGTTTNAITVDWDTTSGTGDLKVVEKSSDGCFGDTVTLAVYRMPKPTATISGADSVCQNFGSSFQVSFTGVGPWNFTYTDGTNSTTMTNVTSNPLTVSTGNLTTSTTYSITAVSNFFGCNGYHSGSATIHVFPKPVTSAIYHN